MTRLPVYVRIGDGAEHRIGTVAAEDPGAVYRAVAELLRACALLITDPDCQAGQEKP